MFFLLKLDALVVLILGVRDIVKMLKHCEVLSRMACCDFKMIIVLIVCWQIETATGRFPYPKWNSVFDQLTQVVQGDPPCLNDVRFSVEFIDFVNTWSELCHLSLNWCVL